MSGFKRAMVSISEEEYRKLHTADIERRFRTGAVDARPQNAETDAAFQKNLDELQNRQAEFERLMEYFNSEVVALEVETGQALVAEKNEFYHELSEQVDGIWTNSARLEEIFKNFQDQYLLDRQRRQAHMRNTDVQINHILRAESQKKELVLSWLNSASALGEFINNQYDHRRFAPGMLDKIYRELALAQNNLRQGMPEAALTTAQQAYAHFSELRLDLEEQTCEWQALFQVTWQAAQNLFEHIRSNPFCQALDMDGKELPVKLMLNFWSNGQYSDLSQRLKVVINVLRAEKSSINCQKLESILQKELPEIGNEFDAIMYQARFAAINSQMRINIADIALQALKLQGFVEDEFGYVSDDMRSPYFLKMKNIEGSQVTIWVSPVDNIENKSDLVVESHDSFEKTEHELRLRSNEITKTLVQYGLRVGSLETESPQQRGQTIIANPQRSPAKTKIAPRV